MAFDINVLKEALEAPSFQFGSIMYTYLKLTDTLAEMLTPGYFNSLVNIWNKDDIVFLNASDGTGIFFVTSVIAPITLQSFNSASSINLNEGNLLLGNSSNVAIPFDASTDTNIIVGDGTTANSVAVSGDITIDNSGVTTIGQVVDGSNIPNITSNNVIGAIPVVHKILVTGGATANYDVILTHKTYVYQVTFQFLGGGSAGDTIQVFNGVAPITESFNGNRMITTSEPAIINNAANATILAGGTLRVTQTDAAGADAPLMFVCVLGMRVP